MGNYNMIYFFMPAVFAGEQTFLDVDRVGSLALKEGASTDSVSSPSDKTAGGIEDIVTGLANISLGISGGKPIEKGVEAMESETVQGEAAENTCPKGFEFAEGEFQEYKHKTLSELSVPQPRIPSWETCGEKCLRPEGVLWREVQAFIFNGAKCVYYTTDRQENKDLHQGKFCKKTAETMQEEAAAKKGHVTTKELLAHATDFKKKAYLLKKENQPSF